MALPLYLQALLLFALVAACTYFFFLAPPKRPENIPAIPFWVTLIPFFFDVDQQDTFKKYLEKPLREYGAVKIFFGSQWNILVSRPEFMAQLFRDEDLFRKSGNFEKIPHSVLAEFMGSNIISDHGENWRLYRSVIRPGLQQNFSTEILQRNTKRLGDMIVATQRHQPGPMPVQNVFQNYTIANSANILLNADFPPLDNTGSSYLSKLQTAVKKEIFKPIFLNFPLLDRLPLPSRQNARALVNRFSDALREGVIRGQDLHGASTDNETKQPVYVAQLLLEAHDNNVLTSKQLHDNLNVTFVASQENPQLALTSTLYLLAKYPIYQNALYAELASASASSAPLDSLPLLSATLLESLRLYPPISQLINRLTTLPATLSSADATVVIPKNTYVGYHAYAANRDPGAWGPDADAFRPERWWSATPLPAPPSQAGGGEVAEHDDGPAAAAGASTTRSAAVAATSRRMRARGAFVTFHGGRRACLGERFAMVELRVAVAGLVQRFEVGLGSGVQTVRMTPAGPLYPRNLKLRFVERDVREEKEGREQMSASN